MPKKPKIDTAELPGLRARYALRQLSPAVQSDVLSDGSIARQLGVGVAHPVTIAQGFTLEREVLFDFLKKAADGQPLPTHISDRQGARRKVKAHANGDDVVITTGKNVVRFQYAMLLTSNASRRAEVARRLLERYTLASANRTKFEHIVRKQDFTADDFFIATTILTGAPEAFAQTLAERARTGQLSKQDFLPDQIGHWDNLTAPLGHSSRLADFVATELKAEREALLGRDPVTGLEIISLTFASPELVPIELLKKISNDQALAAVRHLAESGDPLALTGAFALCVDRRPGDDRFVAVGDALLDRLFSDPTRLCRALVPYSTAFVMATAYLAQHQTLQRKPVYWRRLAAAAHSALVGRTLGEAHNDDESLLSWAMHQSGRAYYLSVVNDASVEPRWRPDWIDVRYLAADIYGRLAASVLLLPKDSVPATWSEKLTKAEEWIAAEHVQLATTYPAITQGAVPLAGEKPAPGSPVAVLYETLMREPTVEHFVVLTPVVWAFGYLPEARRAALTVVQSLRAETKPLEEGMAERTLALGACIAALHQDDELAEAVMQICVERAATSDEDASLLFLVSTMAECAAGNVNRDQALAVLAQRLENLAFVLRPALLDELLELLHVLRSVNEKLGNKLGRAIATARLGRSKGAAA